ncbi:MAG: sensor histidine kinase [Firmicutes bacterium]|nr:sensor histidine kinase [Bacillota bacterium]
MSYAIKGIALIFALTLQVAYAQIMPLEVIGLLLLAVFFIYREKYANLVVVMCVEVVLIFTLSLANPSYLYLYSVIAYDLASYGRYRWIPFVAAVGPFYLRGQGISTFIFLLVISGISGYQRHILEEKETSFRRVYDRERQLRFALEEAKGKLLGAAREAAHIAEIQERNRIAREIHDSIGHNLAGILLQLQVAHKTLHRDVHKADEYLAKSIAGLAASVELLRDTVHNIKPKEQLGLDYLQRVIDNFQFCPVEFSHSGNFNLLTPSQVEIISSILKEGLTNAQRHSQATQVEIKLDSTEQLVRLYIKDNGIGCDHMQEGLGISGMKERIRYAGGHLSIYGKDGFMLVCVLPREMGGAISEGSRR